MFFFFKNVNNFCVINVLENKLKFQHKINFKKKYKFLNLKNSPTNSLTTRIMKRGNYLKIYKFIKKFYYNYTLKDNFKNIPLNSNFLFFFKKYQSFRDLDRVLFWKYNSLDCMFSPKTRKLYVKKKKKINLNLIFISGIKRTLLCINFIKYLILINLKRKKKNLLTPFLYPLYNFIMTDKNNSVIKLKYRVYKHKLMQLQN